MSAEPKKQYKQMACPFCGKSTWEAEDGSFACEWCKKTSADLAYTPTTREYAWWCFLRYEYAHGHFETVAIAVGVDPGAEEDYLAVPEYPVG